MLRKKSVFALSVILLVVGSWFALGVDARLDTITAPAPAAPAQTDIPPEVSYRQLFHAVTLLNQQAAEEEHQGRNGTTQRALVRRLAALDETQITVLTQTAEEYVNTTAALATEAQPLLEEYRRQQSQAISEAPTASPALTTQLQALQNRLTAQTLASREQLRTQLGAEAFGKVEEFVQKNIAHNIQIKPASLTSPESVKPPDRNNRSRTGFNPAKPISPTGPAPAFGFCGDFYYFFVGSALWIDPLGGAVFQISFTAIDFCGGLRYDPYVHGEMESPWENVVAISSRRGRASFIPAVVLMARPALPQTQYAAYSDHLALRRPCLLAPDNICETYFGYYYFGGITPDCLSASLTVGDGPNFIPPCSPPPSPTPTPTPPNVKVEAVGFTGDIPLTHWDKTVSKRIKIDADPDSPEPTWTRQRNPKFAAAYKRGTNPTMFATFSITPALGMTGRTAKLQVKRGNDIIATKDVSLGGNQVTISDISVTGLEAQPVVKRGEYDFTWEISFDGGNTWRPAGNSGKHTIYWTYDTPLARPFRNSNNQECFPISGSPTECDTVYDEALKVATEGLGSNGSDEKSVIVKKANNKVASRTIYQPDPRGSEPSNEHPLIMLDRPAQCSANANTLRGALRSIGIEADTDYVWGGDPGSGKAIFYHFVVNSGLGVTFRVTRPRNVDGPTTVEENPHFTFHAVVAVTNLPDYYDPSYGIVAANKVVNLLETSNHPDSGFLTNAANDRKVIRNSLATFSNLRQSADRICSDQPLAGNLFPNPIDGAADFVAQQYRDFLGREPDAGGLEFWAGLITACGSNQQCIAERRVLVSKEFFLSVEFQQTGAFVQRLHKATYGRNPVFDEFLPGAHSLTVGDNSPEALELKKQAYLDDWVQGSDFIENYYLTTNAEYVDALFANAGVTPTTQERADLINGLDNNTESLATVLRKVIDHPTLVSAEFNRSFVLMQYFGYLRRDPDQGGYDFWLSILNETNDQYGMVSAFVTSTEYRARFGQP